MEKGSSPLMGPSPGEFYMHKFEWSAGHPTYPEESPSFARPISGLSFEVSGIA